MNSFFFFVATICIITQRTHSYGMNMTFEKIFKDSLEGPNCNLYSLMSSDDPTCGLHLCLCVILLLAGVAV